MKKKLISVITAAALVMPCVPLIARTVNNAEATENPVRIMEKLDRGLVAVKVSGGVYLSWRLLGTESLSNQVFDIYKNGTFLASTGAHDATCYTDATGTAGDEYKVVKAGMSADNETAVTPWTTNVAYSKDGFSNSVAYKELKFDAPPDGVTPATTANPDGEVYSYGKYYDTDKKNASRVGINDMSVGDLDGDGEYELIVKWDPSNSKDNSNTGYTGKVYIDAYEFNEFEEDGVTNKRLWRIELGENIRAGAHYTQYLVYDFDCDGKSELICKTAPLSKDGNNQYVTAAGATDEIKNAANKSYLNTSGTILSGPEYLTVFNGETGAAMQTVNYEPPRDITDKWGDSYGNRCERYLAGVAYLDGVHPSAVMTRGYYTYAYAAAYSWDGTNLSLQWLSSNEPNTCTVKYADGTTKKQTGKTLYGQGAHSVSVADIDNDGCDEVVFGSAVLDNDGTVLIYDGRGHGDAEHVSDFDNDGKQEIFFVHEAGKEDKTIDIPFAVDIKRYDESSESGAYDIMLQSAKDDIGRGVIANIDDEYALASWENGEKKGLSAFWSVAANGLYNEAGEEIGTIPKHNSYAFQNSFAYWDGDLGRELLDGTMLAKHSVENGTTRIYYNNSNTYYGAFTNVSSINGTKSNASLSADIFGDWREELIFPLSDGTGARIYMSTIPTDYRLTTLMHDSQYRCAVAWQNVGYNQPPHTSYYIGSAALAKSGTTTLNYLDPAVSFTKVTYPDEEEEDNTEPVQVRKTVEITPEADTYIAKDDATAHGEEPELKVNMATNVYSLNPPGLKDPKGLGLIRFDTSAYSNIEIESAVLRIYDKFNNSDNANSTLHVDYCSQDNWDEKTFTISDIAVRSNNTPLSSLGITISPTFTKTYTKLDIDVTDAIKADSDHKHTFTLWTQTAREQVIASREYTGSDAAGPTLVLTYSVMQTPSPKPAKASPTPLPSLKPSPTTSPTPVVTPSPTPSPSPAPVATQSPTPSPSPTPVATPTPIATATPVTDDTYINVTEDTLNVSGDTLTGAVRATIENYTDGAKLILAVYDGSGVLKNAQIKSFTGAAVEFDALNLGGMNGNYYYKVFAWRDLQSLAYVCGEYRSKSK